MLLLKNHKAQKLDILHKALSSGPLPRFRIVQTTTADVKLTGATVDMRAFQGYHGPLVLLKFWINCSHLT